jgi:hypothetical protein
MHDDPCPAISQVTAMDDQFGTHTMRLSTRRVQSSNLCFAPLCHGVKTPLSHPGKTLARPVSTSAIYEICTM